MKNVTKENGKYVVTANADVFIVPTAFFTVDPEYTNCAKRICESIGREFSPDELFGRFWITSEDLNSSNLGCHGFRVGGRVYVDSSEMPNSLPVDLFKDLKEDESKEIIFSVMAEDIDTDEKIPVELHLNVTAKQVPYRYRYIGTFQKAFAYANAEVKHNIDISEMER